MSSRGLERDSVVSEAVVGGHSVITAEPTSVLLKSFYPDARIHDHLAFLDGEVPTPYFYAACARDEAGCMVPGDIETIDAYVTAIEATLRENIEMSPREEVLKIRRTMEDLSGERAGA